MVFPGIGNLSSITPLEYGYTALATSFPLAPSTRTARRAPPSVVVRGSQYMPPPPARLQQSAGLLPDVCHRPVGQGLLRRKATVEGEPAAGLLAQSRRAREI